MKELTNPISGYRITIMGATGDQTFGWIELLNGPKSAGYVYFSSKTDNSPDHLSFDGTYIVMHQPVSFLPNLLTILRDEASLQIRFFDPESPGVAPSTFIESLGATPLGVKEDPKLLT